MRWLFVTLTLLLAGCTSSPEAPIDAEPETKIITDPTDFEYNASQAHVHDYWAGADRITVMEEVRTQGSTSSDVAFVSFRPGRDQTIPQGTAVVEVTFTWTPDPQALVGDASVWLHGADSFEWTEQGAAENGVAFAVPSSNAMNDLPHARLSGWQFAIGFEAPAAYAHWSGTVEIRVEAVRGLKIPEYPGHPDRWNGASELPLFEHSGPAAFADGFGGKACIVACPAYVSSQNVVPHDADHVRVEVRSDSPLASDLRYHGADTWEWTVVAATTNDPDIYLIPVDGNGDGPYAPRSLWAFELVSAAPNNGAFAGNIDIEAWAVRA